jgi:hypothetical protein
MIQTLAVKTIFHVFGIKSIEAKNMESSPGIVASDVILLHNGI